MLLFLVDVNGLDGQLSMRLGLGASKTFGNGVDEIPLQVVHQPFNVQGKMKSKSDQRPVGCQLVDYLPGTAYIQVNPEEFKNAF